MKILVADDHPTNRKHLHALLSHEGHMVIECEDGLTALAALEQNACDAVISDVLMPKMDGYRLCYEIRKNKKLKDIPIILYTATYLSAADERAALAMGADKFVRKPAPQEEILNALNEVVENTRDRKRDKTGNPSESSALREYSEALVRKLEDTNIQLSVANATLVENERRLRAIIESEPECVKILARDGTLLEMNPAGLGMIEADSASQIVGKDVYGLIVPEHRRPFQELNEATFRGESGALEFEIVGLKGTRRWLGTHTAPLRNSKGQVVAVLGITRDITEQKRNAALLTGQMRVLEMIARGAPLRPTLDALLCVIEAQSDGMFCSIFLLDADSRSLRHGAAPSLPASYIQAIDGEVVGEAMGSCGTAIYRREPVIVEDIASDPQWQNWRDIALTHGLRACWSTPIFDAQRRVLGSFAIYFRAPRRPAEAHLKLIDIATHVAAIALSKQREEAVLRESEARFREMADNAPVMIWMTNPDGSCTYLNKQWQDFTGQIDETGLGEGWLDAVHPEDRARVARDFAETNRRHALFQSEYRLRQRAGGYRWAMDWAQPRVSESGEFLGYIGSVLDISERKQAEDERQRSLDRVRTLHEINLAITSPMNRQNRLDTLLEKIETFFAYPIVSSLRLFRPETGRLEGLAQRGVNLNEWLDREPRRTLHRAARVVQNKAPLVVADVQSDACANDRPLSSSFGLASYAGVPLIARDQVIGVLGVYTKDRHEFSAEEIGFLSTVAGQAAIAIENAELFEETERRRREAEELARIAQSITETLDMKAVGERVVASVLELFRVEGSSLRLRDPDGSLHRFVAAGDVFSRTEPGAVMPSGVGLAGQALAEGKTVWSADTLNDRRVEFHAAMREYIAKTGNGSMIAVPLYGRNNAIGTLTLVARTGRSYSQREVDLLQTFADQVSLALQNARLYDDITHAKNQLEVANLSLDRSLKQLDSLYTTLAPLSPGAADQEILDEIIGRLIETTGADAGLIRIWDAETRNYKIVSHRGFPATFLARVETMPAGGSVDWVVSHAEPILAPDIAAENRFLGKTQLSYGFRSAAMLPLIAHEDVRGVMQLSSRQFGHFNEGYNDYLMAIARQIGIALANRRLFNDLERSRDALAKANAALTESNRMLSALHTVASASSQSLNLELILNAAIRKITEIFHFDATRIHLFDKQRNKLTLRASFEHDHKHFSPKITFQRGEGVVGAVAQSGEKMIFTDAPKDRRYRALTSKATPGKHSHQFLAVLPIKGKVTSLGTITCVNNARRSLGASEIELLEAIADQLAVAIENSWLYEDVRLKVDELQLKTIELERANRVKDEFLGVVSHELRTPINVIMGYTALFKEGVLGEVKPGQEEALVKIARESKELLGMINTLLFATTLESEAVNIEAQEFSPENLLAELRANYAVTAPGRVVIEWRYTASLPKLNTDRRKLKQVLDNLIGNAIKFTEQGTATVAARAVHGAQCGSVPLALNAKLPALEFTVSDTGVGIPREKLDQIFDKFYQVDSSGTRRFGGVGLGLYIAKKFTDLLGGCLTVASTEGVGSTFTVTIPCEPNAAKR